MSDEKAPVEEDRKGASPDPRRSEGAVADPLKVKKPESKTKKARSRERTKRNMGPFE
jgi:hypothetical protein